jgi:hypothetical protein
MYSEMKRESHNNATRQRGIVENFPLLARRVRMTLIMMFYAFTDCFRRRQL